LPFEGQCHVPLNPGICFRFFWVEIILISFIVIGHVFSSLVFKDKDGEPIHDRLPWIDG
jgi:hypothetical protein